MKRMLSRISVFAVKPYSGASILRPMSTFSADMTRNLKIKVVAFDLSLVLAAETKKNEKPKKETSSSISSSSSQASIAMDVDKMSMATMDGLDGDVNVHRHRPPVVDAPHTGKLITYSAHQVSHSSADGDELSESSPSMLQSPKISKEELAAEAAKSAAEYKNKYADKIKMKRAKQAQAEAATPGGGNILNIATRWLLKEGMGDVLDYTFNRTVKIAILGGYDTSNATIEQLKSQLNGTHLSFVRQHPLQLDANNKETLNRWTEEHWNSASKLSPEQEAHRRHLWSNGMENMESALNVTKAQILFISGDENALMLARDRGYYTCRYTGEAKRFGQITTDFKAEDSLQIRDAIDGLIGIALRHSVSFIPFR